MTFTAFCQPFGMTHDDSSLTRRQVLAVAGAPTPNYTEFETFTLVRPRSDRRGVAGRTPEASPVTA